MDLKEKVIAILGVGKIGETIATGLIAKEIIPITQLIGTDTAEKTREEVTSRLGISTIFDNVAAVRAADIVIVAVKPQQVDDLLATISEAVTKEKLLISVAASVPIDRYRQALAPGCRIIRAMPNSPMLIGYGMTALCLGKECSDDDFEMARIIFESAGRTALVEERLMDGVTGLSGSGPAYVYVIIEALAEAGVKLGIPRDVSTLLAAQTVAGAAQMVLETGKHPALLKDVVTTPAGCTVDGLLELEEGKLRVTLLKAVVKAAERAAQLKNER